MSDDERRQDGNIPVIRIDEGDLADLSSLLGETVPAPPSRAEPSRPPPPRELPPRDAAASMFDELLGAASAQRSSAPSSAPPPPSTPGVVHVDVDEVDDDFEALLQRTLGEAAGGAPKPDAPPRSLPPQAAPRAPRAWGGPKPPRGPTMSGPAALSKLADQRRDERRQRDDRHKEESKVIDALRKKVKDMTAETEKYRQRVAAEAGGARTKGRADVFKALMPIIDTLELALKAATESRDYDALHHGLELCFKQLLGGVRSLGLEDVDAQGAIFDPAKHEAVQQQKTGTMPPGTVLHMLRRGYIHDEKLMRPAQVVVEAG